MKLSLIICGLLSLIPLHEKFISLKSFDSLYDGPLQEYDDTYSSKDGMFPVFGHHVSDSKAVLDDSKAVIEDSKSGLDSKGIFVETVELPDPLDRVYLMNQPPMSTIIRNSPPTIVPNPPAVTNIDP